MSVSAFDLARLRRMVDEPTTTPYTDVILTAYIELSPLMDERGVEPFWWDTSVDPPVQVATVGWIPTWDLHNAASMVWEEKASVVAELFDFPAREGNFQHSRQYVAFKEKARYYGARKAARSAHLIASPSFRRRGDSWIANLPEEP
jgi:hypothetical protein